MHLINDCPDMIEWRKEWFEKLRVKSMDKIIDLITSKQWEKVKITIADIVNVIRKFEEKLKKLGDSVLNLNTISSKYNNWIYNQK